MLEGKSNGLKEDCKPRTDHLKNRKANSHTHEMLTAAGHSLFML